LQTFFLGFACNFPPFDQEPIRRAFAKAINRAELVQTVWSNVQKPATGGLIPSGMPGHSPEIGHQFDPEAAHTLLTESRSDQNTCNIYG
jgi:ABC-type transport system substrate-binding protein